MGYMAEYFNKKSGLSGTVPLGSFNSMFSLTGSRKVDAAATKALAMDAKLASDDLVLPDDVKRAVPRNWDPPLLARLVDKPPIEELQYFLDFQVQRVWAPAPVNIPGHQRKEPVCPSLQFSLMGPKLYISSEQVSVGRKPVTGLRISLEGNKRNRLAIHIQHLAILPKILLPHWDSHVAIGPPRWQGPEEQDSRWFEPIKWKNFAHVSTAPIESNETNIGDLSGVYIVTGAQLGVWDFGARSVLHLKLLFSKVPGCTIRRSVWDHTPSTTHAPKSEDTSSSALADNNKLVKIVDTTEMLKGPQDTPGHWLVTGAKLGVEKGKIVVRVKYSLLNY
ncbi:MAC Perforin domain containing protein [Musa troglodytarum]|uniref:MAC Perforin domain containing protein n=1 Tax=Musa troglodytarum TaxID=320322 RepID=A0A9E7GUG7_9LILI|nr:MAC Perforin domain containing protein [Musa troglodytarum]